MDNPSIPYIVIGLILGLVIIIIKRMPGLMLQEKFKKIGSMAGMTKTEIVNAVGSFDGITHRDDGSQVCVWQSGAFIITIEFTKDGKFSKIISQTVAK